MKIGKYGLVTVIAGILAANFLIGSLVFAQTMFVRPKGEATATIKAAEEETAKEECPEAFAAGCTCKYPFGDKGGKQATVYGECLTEAQDCKTETLKFSCCICSQPKTDGSGETITGMKAASGHTQESCKELCEGLDPPGWVNPEFGAGNPRVVPAVSDGSNAAAQVKAGEALCFTQAQCATAEYGGSPSAFRVGYGCSKGGGRCVAPEPEIPLSVAIGGVKTVKGLRSYIAATYKYMVSIAAIAAAIMFVYGGFRYIFGSISQNINRAKEIMVDSAVGLILVLSAMMILRTFNEKVLDMTRLDVFMINKQQFLFDALCKDIESATPIMLAEAGTFPNYKSPEEIQGYAIPVDDAVCDFEYYVQGFVGNRCLGTSCSSPGESCLLCKSGTVSECLGRKRGGVCVPLTFSGQLTSKAARVRTLRLLYVCNHAQGESFDVAANGIFQLDGAEFGGGANMLGADIDTELSEVTDVKKWFGIENSNDYRFSFTEETLKKAEDNCNAGGRGGLKGFLIHATYLSIDVIPEKFTSFSSWISAAGSAATEKFQMLDSVLLSKADCGSTGIHSGYADGSIGQDVSDARAAYWCNTHLTPKGGVMHLNNPANYWTMEEMQKAIADHESISCDINIFGGADANAPDDPGTKLNNGCTANTSRKDLP